MTTRKDPLQFPEYSEAQNAYLEELMQRAERETAAQVAIVDQLGFKYQPPSGKIRTITERSASNVRFEIRSRAHCKVYGFKIIYRNRKWRVAAEAERAAAARAEEAAQ